MSINFQTIAFQMDTALCLRVYEASALITLANILLAKTSQVAKLMVNVKGTTHRHKYKKTVYPRSMRGSTAQQALQSESAPILIYIRNVINCYLFPPQ